MRLCALPHPSVLCFALPRQIWSAHQALWIQARRSHRSAFVSSTPSDPPPHHQQAACIKPASVLSRVPALLGLRHLRTTAASLHVTQAEAEAAQAALTSSEALEAQVRIHLSEQGGQSQSSRVQHRKTGSKGRGVQKVFDLLTLGPWPRMTHVWGVVTQQSPCPSQARLATALAKAASQPSPSQQAEVAALQSQLSQQQEQHAGMEVRYLTHH